jgi:predicted ABC-type transport system involved in lysophospholipase L1 biosynthesis ATPase subunit
MGRLPASATAARAAEVLARVGLAERMEHRPWELSGGEQQRVAIARALVNSPDLILADEPTGNLDSRSGEEIIHLLQELRSERQATLIIATHDAGVAARAPRVLELADGRIAN